MKKLTKNILPSLRHKNILSTIGSTPLVQITSPHLLKRPDVQVFAKLEAFNPAGSVKDRLALGVIEWAEQNGQLSPGQTVVECSSGNTGIGLAAVCASKGYPFVCVMSESFSIERRKLMRYLGARVILTNPAHKGSGMLLKASELADKHGWFLTKQFENEANADIHEKTTGPEIIEAMEKKTVDHFFSSYGTGGTLLGIARHLRNVSPSTKIHVCEPDNAPLLFSEIKSTYSDNGTLSSPHPLWRPHLLQGWAPDFIPKLVGDAKDEGYIDHLTHVSGDAAIECAKALASREGILSGISGGGSMIAALDFANDRDKCQSGSNIVVMVPDTAERYISTPLFADIPADMTEEEIAISESTPSQPPPSIELPLVTEEALRFIEDKNKTARIVIWSLEYCEFCWTTFKLLDALNVPYTVINVDAFEYVKDNQGNQFRSGLNSITDVNTFPQIFVGGEFFGGAVDLCLSWKNNELQDKFDGMSRDGEFGGYEGDPFEFLPKWMSQNPLRST